MLETLGRKAIHTQKLVSLVMRNRYNKNTRSSQRPSIKISAWNINGLISKECNKLNDENFIKMISDKDIIILTETKCQKDQTIHLPGYYCFQVNRTPLKTAKTESGGIAFLCKQEYRQGIRILPENSEDFLWIRLRKEFFNIKDDLYICAIYDPPPQSSYSLRQQQDPLEYVEELIIKYSKKGNIMVLGDLNARTSDSPDFIVDDSDIAIPIFVDDSIPTRLSQDKVLDVRGKHLLELCIQSQMRILNGRSLGDTIGKFTCHTYNGNSVVDYSIVSEAIYHDVVYFHVEQFEGTLSDHCMITTLLEIQNPISITQSRINLYKIIKPTKWSDRVQSIFMENINNKASEAKLDELTTNCSSNNVEKTVESLSEFLLKCMPKSKVNRNRHANKGQRKNKQWYTGSLYRLRQRVIRKGQYISENPFDRNARTSFFYLRKIYRKTCKAQTRQYKSNLIKKLESLQYHNPKQYWKILNELLENKNEKSNPSTSISPGDWYDYLLSLKTDGKTSSIEDTIDKKLQCLERNKMFNELDFCIKEKEIQKSLMQVKTNKAVGLDGICNEMLKCANKAMVNLMAKIFNTILLNGTYPKIWNRGYVSTIYKSKDIQDPNNYRCLTINSCFGKLFNRILNNRLDSYLKNNEIINPCQIGFQSKKRTTDHIYTLQTVVKKYTKLYKKKIYACFIDLRKAFDKVWHAGLLYKLKMIGISHNFYNVIKDMYLNTEVCMKFNDERTDFLHPTVGVKQGDNLSSSLFNIYINDLNTYFTAECEPVEIGMGKVHCLMYADDLILLSESAQGLQNSLNILSNYCSIWKLEINHAKSKVILFEPRKQPCTFQFSIGSITLERVYMYNYLGIIIDYKGDLTQAKTDLYLRAQKAYFKLRKLLNIDIIKPKLYLEIFDRTVVPILNYGSELWGTFNIKTKKYKQLQNPEYMYEDFQGEKLQTKLCKILLGVNQKTSNLATRAELGRYPLMITTLSNMLSYRSRLENLETNDLLKGSFNDDFLLHNHGLSTWYSCTEEIMRCTNINKDYIRRVTPKTVRKKTIHKLKQSYDTFFRTAIFDDQRRDPNEKNKLRTYRLFKRTIRYEKYLELNISKNIMKKFTQLRLSAHKLCIETARHIKVSMSTRNEQKLKARKCKLCETNNDEDELHFLMFCPKYNKQRNILLSEIYDQCRNASLLSKADLFIWLMSNEDIAIMKKLILYVNECFTLRSSQHQQQNS